MRARVLLRPAGPRVVHVAAPHQPVRWPLLPMKLARLFKEIQVAERRPPLHKAPVVARDLLVIEPGSALPEPAVERPQNPALRVPLPVWPERVNPLRPPFLP